jgi:predicted ester cyclase
MDHAATQALIGRVFEEAIDGADYSLLGELFHDDYVDHTTMGDNHGTDAFTGMLEGFRAAMPDFHHDVQDVTVLTDEIAVWQIHITGTFTGEFMGTAGRGQAIDLWVANAARIRDGKVAEHWALGPDSLAELMRQMEVAAPAAA